MLEVVGTAPGSNSDVDWTKIWRSSPERNQVRSHLEELATKIPRLANREALCEKDSDYKEFSASFPTQVTECARRIFVHYWRTPSYIYSKLALSVVSVGQAMSGMHGPKRLREVLISVLGNVHWLLLLQVGK